MSSCFNVKPYVALVFTRTEAPDPWYPFGMESAQRKQGRPATTAEAWGRL